MEQRSPDRAERRLLDRIRARAQAPWTRWLRGRQRQYLALGMETHWAADVEHNTKLVLWGIWGKDPRISHAGQWWRVMVDGEPVTVDRLWDLAN